MPMIDQNGLRTIRRWLLFGAALLAMGTWESAALAAPASVAPQSAAPLDAAANGTYHLGTPERGTSQVLVQAGELNGKKVLAVAACRSCPPAVYSYLQEPSETLGLPIYSIAGLYVIQQDADTLVIVQPDAELGRQVWGRIGHANLYSRDAARAAAFDRTAVEGWAIALSERIMNQETGAMAHAAGRYFLAVPQQHMGQLQESYDIRFVENPRQQIVLTPCPGCTPTTYDYLPEASEATGVGVFGHAGGDNLFDLKDGVLVQVFSSGGLGSRLLVETDYFNVLSNNRNYVRQIVSSQEQQKVLDDLLKGYFQQVKTVVDARLAEEQKTRVANQQLPQAGFSDTALNQAALAAAQRWASAWQWPETLDRAFMVSADWSILRNPLSGVVTGRRMSGVVTMRHPDGRCRFQYVGFRQDHDGRDFVNLHMTGTGPIYDLPCERL